MGPRTIRNRMYRRANAYSNAGSALERKFVLAMSIVAAAREIRTRFITGAVISPRNMRAIALCCRDDD